jgi:16S rRNA G966 N2-methylase RsmD
MRIRGKELTSTVKKRLMQEVEKSVRNAIEEIFPGESKSIKIKLEIICIDNHPYTGSRYLKMVVYIQSNNPNRLLGLVHRNEKGKPTGPYSFYINGFLDASLYSKSPREFSLIDEVELVVSETKGLSTIEGFVDVETVRNHGLVPRRSELNRILSKYELPYVLVIGRAVSGPDLDIIRIAEKINLQNLRVLDMFSGTGGIASVCLQKGAKHVVAVEQNTQALIALKSRFGDRLSIVDTDAFSFRCNDYFDIAFFNPYYDETLFVAREIIPRLETTFERAFLSVCSRWNKPYLTKVLDTLSNNRFKYRVIKGNISNIVELKGIPNVRK